MKHTIHFITIIFFILCSGATELRAQGTEFFLDIPNIPGDANQRGYEGQICVTNFTWAVERGADRSGVTPERFRVQKALDQASVELFSVLTTGASIQEATLSIVGTTPDGTRQLRAVYEFNNVVITDFEPSGNPAESPIEVIGWIAEEVTVEYYGANGNLVNSHSFNFSTNTSN